MRDYIQGDRKIISTSRPCESLRYIEIERECAQKPAKRAKGTKLPGSKGKFLGFIIPAIILLAWLIYPNISDTPEYTLPSLNDVVKNFIDFAFGSHNLSIYSGTLVSHLSSSVVRVMVGYSIAAVLGLIFGYITGCYCVIHQLLNPVISFIRTIPGIAWLPISIVWFGIGGIQSIFLISLAAFFPIFINTCHGVISIDKELVEASKVCGADSFNKFKHIILPLSLKNVLVGLRVGLGLSWAYLVLGEMTGVNKGIGAVMQDARILGQTQMIIVCMLHIALTAMIFDTILNAVTKIINKKYF